MDCGITNLGSCLAEKLFEFIIYILNLPLKPLLEFTRILLTEPVNILIFAEVWAVIIYILSMFYGFLLLMVGFRFLVSGYSVEQREKAKSGLRNIIIMIVLVQASFFLYSLALDLSSSVSVIVFNMIKDEFFLITADNIANLGLELIFLIPYVASVTITLIFLSIRYICVSVGVIFFTIGLFLYFIGSLKSYGELILNYLGVLISLPFLYSLIFLASAKILEIPTFQNFKILVMIGAFSLVNLITIFIILFVIIKTANAVSSPIKQITPLISAVA